MKERRGEERSVEEAKDSWVEVCTDQCFVVDDYDHDYDYDYDMTCDGVVFRACGWNEWSF